MIKGIDVSSIQNAGSPGGNIDWDGVVKMGVRFAMVKCGNGNDKPDPCFRKNVDGAKAAGIFVGAYHFTYPLPHIDPAQAAQEHFAACGGLGSSIGELPPACDLEWPPPEGWDEHKCDAVQLRAWGLTYLREMRTLYGCTPLLYSYPWWLRAAGVAGDIAFANFDLWMADYSPPLDVPAPWSKASMWQVGGGKSLRLPGGAPVDEDAIPDEDTLDALLSRVQPVSPIAAE